MNGKGNVELTIPVLATLGVPARLIKIEVPVDKSQMPELVKEMEEYSSTYSITQVDLGFSMEPLFQEQKPTNFLGLGFDDKKYENWKFRTSVVDKGKPGSSTTDTANADVITKACQLILENNFQTEFEEAFHTPLKLDGIASADYFYTPSCIQVEVQESRYGAAGWALGGSGRLVFPTMLYSLTHTVKKLLNIEKMVYEKYETAYGPDFEVTTDAKALDDIKEMLIGIDIVSTCPGSAGKRADSELAEQEADPERAQVLAKDWKHTGLKEVATIYIATQAECLGDFLIPFAYGAAMGPVSAATTGVLSVGAGTG